MVTVVCDTGVFVQDIFFLGAAADVMNDERRAVFRAAVGDDANVQQVAGQAPGDDILLTQGADDDVGTDAGLHGNITQWIVQLTVSTVVTDSTPICARASRTSWLRSKASADAAKA